MNNFFANESRALLVGLKQYADINHPLWVFTSTTFELLDSETIKPSC